MATDRVPVELQMRVRNFLNILDGVPQLQWFIITGNMAYFARCMMKILYEKKLAPGRVIDRNLMRQVVPEASSDAKKAAFVEKLIESRKKHGSPPLDKILFADNEPAWRNEMDSMLTNLNVKHFICCTNLNAGLQTQHIDELMKEII